MPIIFVCEDNGIGISVRTPPSWVEASMSGRTDLAYIACDGLNLADTYRASKQAETIARRHKRPVFLHFKCTRLYGHAGADVQTAYLSQADIDAAEALDPLLQSARMLMAEWELSADDVLNIYNSIEAELQALLPWVRTAPRLSTADDVARTIVPSPQQPTAPAPISDTERETLFGSDLAAMSKPAPMSRLINWALTDLMATNPQIIVAGEDVGRKGGVYGVTQKLQKRFGASRVIDTLLDEQSILGLSIGLAHNGYLPIPEIQFLAYLHNAEDQLRGEAATLSFFSQGQFTNPMVVRIAGLGYQRGFGGHFHNDNAIGVLRDIPGLIVACPSGGAEAVRMLRECMRLSRDEGRVCVFLEPIALYPMRDLHTEGDQGWMDVYPTTTEISALGSIAIHGAGTDVAIVTYGNGVRLSIQAQATLAKDHGVDARVIDLRWLAPLPVAAVLDAVSDCRSVLVVDECRRSGSVSEALVTGLVEVGYRGRVARETATDSFIPLGPAATVTLPSKESIVTAVLAVS